MIADAKVFDYREGVGKNADVRLLSRISIKKSLGAYQIKKIQKMHVSVNKKLQN